MGPCVSGPRPCRAASRGGPSPPLRRGCWAPPFLCRAMQCRLSKAMHLPVQAEPCSAAQCMHKAFALRIPAVRCSAVQCMRKAVHPPVPAEHCDAGPCVCKGSVTPEPCRAVKCKAACDLDRLYSLCMGPLYNGHQLVMPSMPLLLQCRECVLSCSVRISDVLLNAATLPRVTACSGRYCTGDANGGLAACQASPNAVGSRLHRCEQWWRGCRALTVSLH